MLFAAAAAVEDCNATSPAVILATASLLLEFGGPPPTVVEGGGAGGGGSGTFDAATRLKYSPTPILWHSSFVSSSSSLLLTLRYRSFGSNALSSSSLPLLPLLPFLLFLLFVIGVAVDAGTRSRRTDGGSDKFLRSKKAKRFHRELVDIVMMMMMMMDEDMVVLGVTSAIEPENGGIELSFTNA